MRRVLWCGTTPGWIQCAASALHHNVLNRKRHFCDRGLNRTRPCSFSHRLQVDADAVEVFDINGHIVPSQMNPVWTEAGRGQHRVAHDKFELLFFVDLQPTELRVFTLKRSTQSKVAAEATPGVPPEPPPSGGGGRWCPSGGPPPPQRRDDPCGLSGGPKGGVRPTTKRHPSFPTAGSLCHQAISPCPQSFDSGKAPPPQGQTTAEPIPISDSLCNRMWISAHFLTVVITLTVVVGTTLDVAFVLYLGAARLKLESVLVFGRFLGTRRRQ